MVYPKAVRVGNSPNQDPRRAKVSQVILHHTASTGDVNGIWNMFMSPNSRSVSANFLVAQNGSVLEVVNPDTGRAWTTGGGPNGTISPDHSAITMECMDKTGDPTWLQSAESQEAIAQAVAWASARYGFPIIRGVTVRGHREMPGQNTTACPGGMPLDSITARAIAIRGGAEEEDDMYEQKDRVRDEKLLELLVGLRELLVDATADGKPSAVTLIRSTASEVTEIKGNVDKTYREVSDYPNAGGPSLKSLVKSLFGGGK